MLGDYAQQLRRISRNARLYVISNAIQAVSAGALAVLYTLYLQSLGYSTDFIGVTIVLATVGGGLGIIPANYVVGRWGWRTTLIWSDLIGGVALFLQLVYPQPAVVLITAVGAGASVALLLVVNTPFLAAYSREEERTSLFAVSNALALLAGVAGLLLGGFLPGWLGSAPVRGSGLLAALSPWLVHGERAQTYELALLLTGVLALPSIVPVLMLSEDRQSQSPPVAARTLRAIWPGAATLRALVLRTATGPIGRFTAAQVLVAFGAGLFGPYLNLYFVNARGASTAQYGVLSSVLTVLVAAGSLVVVPFSDRFGKIRAAVLTQLSSLPFLLMLGLTTSLPLAAAAFLIRGPLMNAANPPLQAYYMERVPRDDRVLASSVYNVSWQLVWALGAGAGGVLIARAGYPPTFFGATALYTVSILLVALWFGRPGPDHTHGSAVSPGGQPAPSASSPSSS
jgi:MFS family permease